MCGESGGVCVSRAWVNGRGHGVVLISMTLPENHSIRWIGRVPS